MKFAFGTVLADLDDEATQVNGIVYLLDFRGFTMKHQTFWGIDGTRRSAKIFSVRTLTVQWNLGIRDTQGTVSSCPDFYAG